MVIRGWLKISTSDQPAGDKGSFLYEVQIRFTEGTKGYPQQAYQEPKYRNGKDEVKACPLKQAIVFQVEVFAILQY